MSERLPLTQLAADKTAIVVEIKGGRGLLERLEGLGIRIGQRISKVSGPFMHGPVTIKAGNIRVALGYGAAGKVIVEVAG